MKIVFFGKIKVNNRELYSMRRIAAMICILAFTGCYNDKADKLYPKGGGPPGGGCDTMAIAFKKDIQPILTNSCALSGCHDAATPSNGYNFAVYDGAKLAVDNNRLLGAVRHESGFSMMPKGMTKLDDCSLNKMTRWVNLGAPNN
jgi:hypothetical protein